MRILLSIHHQLDPHTGAPGATAALGEGLAGLGHEVEYLSFDDLPSNAPFLAASVAYPYFAAVAMARRARHGLDVIDASTGDAWAWARFARGRGGPVLATRSHGLEHLFQQRELERANREGRRMSWRYPLYWGGWRLREVTASLRASDLLFVLSREERDYVVGRLGIDPERVQLTANGVPPSFLRRAEEVSASAPPPGAGGKVAMVGAHRPNKGVEPGTAAVVAAMEAEPQMRVSILGAMVPPAEVFARFPAALHPRISVTERYRREQLPELLAGCSLAVFPSFSEGFSLAVVETMLCGVVPVATDIGGHRDVVREEVTGLLVPPDDPAAMSDAIVRLLRNPELLGRLSAGARKEAEPYSWSKIAARTAASYEAAIERRQRDPRRGAGRR